MTKKRRIHTKEFKEEAVRLITEQGYSIAETARNLGINANMLGKWKKDLENVESRDAEALRAENRRLQKENRRLKMEREILKKAAAFFAGETS